jgi:hypothetical protein
MTMQDLSSVSDNAKALEELMYIVLEKVEAVYQSYNMPIPSRRYWTFGPPAVDCEQLVISFVQMYLGPPGGEIAEPRRCNDPRSAILQISVSREVPTAQQNGAPPTAESIIKGNKASVYDSWILMESAAQLDSWETSGFGLGVIATIETTPPEGGYQTIVLTLTLAVP